MPLPGARSPHAPVSVLGWWRGWVECAVVPYTVSVPELFGSGVAVPAEVSGSVLFDAPLAAHEPVWVTCIQGVTNDLVVTGRRV